MIISRSLKLLNVFSTHKNQMYPEKRENRWCRGEDDRKSKGWLRFPLI